MTDNPSMLITATEEEDGFLVSKKSWRRLRACGEACRGLPTDRLTPGLLGDLSLALDRLANFEEHGADLQTARNKALMLIERLRGV